jgi:xanthine dehydrogenase accessory factor
VNPAVEERAADLRHQRLPFVHARVVRAERPTSAKPGDEAVVLPDGSIDGFVGGACAESTVRAQSLSLLDSGRSLLLRILPEGAAVEADADGTLTVVNPCLSGGSLEIFLEPVVPDPLVAVVGESPIAAALVALGDGTGFRMMASTTAALEITPGLTAVVVASHGRDEEAALTAAVQAGVPYVGLVASRKRGEAVVAALDLDPAQRTSVHTPAGLDIGARTPREVALSILAEIVALRPRPAGGAGVAAPVVDRDDEAGDRAPVEVATDPVCGMAVVADDAALHLDHDGTRHWFCGTGCLRAFAADPSAYLPDPAG